MPVEGINLYYVDVMLEVTRWCNMFCCHCLRGDRQKKRMATNIIDMVAERVPDIGTLMVTGGEPLLALDLIEYAVDHLNYQNFWLATNGSIFTKKTKEVLKKAFDNAGDGDISGMRISIDDYHDKSMQEHKYDLQEWWEYEVGKELSTLEFEGASRNSELLIKDGRAKTNLFTLDSKSPKHDLRLLDNEYLEGVIYVNVYGNVLTTCDLSFENADAKGSVFNIGHISGDLESNIVSYFNKNPEMIYK